MAERDWLSELSEAIGDDLARDQRVEGTDDELLLSGSGRSLEGWADQLAEAIGEELPAERSEPVDAASAFATWDNRPATAAPQPVEAEPRMAAAPPAAPAPPAGPAAVDPAILQRLARIEALLGADLDKLGPAVLAESVEAIEKRVQAALARLSTLDGPLAQLEERVTAHARTLSEPVRVQAVVPPELGELLGQLATRFSALEQVIAEATAELDADESPAGPPPQPLPEVVELGHIVLEVKERVEDLAARPVTSIDPDTLGPVVDFEPLLGAIRDQRVDTQGLAAVLHDLEQGLAELRQRPAPEPIAPSPPIDIDPLLVAMAEQRAELVALTTVVNEVANRPEPLPAPAPTVDLGPLSTGFEELKALVGQLYAAVVDAAAKPVEPDRALLAEVAQLRELLAEQARDTARHQEALVERIDTAAAALAGSTARTLAVSPEALAPVTKVIGDRVDAAAGSTTADLERVAKRVVLLGNRLAKIEASMAETATTEELIRQAIRDLAEELAGVRRALGG